MGTQQSGVLNLKIANIVKDKGILSLARQHAAKILKEDPELRHPNHVMIVKTMTAIGRYKNIWSYIS